METAPNTESQRVASSGAEAVLERRQPAEQLDSNLAKRRDQTRLFD
jgi:hypothetical protein